MHPHQILNLVQRLALLFILILPFAIRRETFLEWLQPKGKLYFLIMECVALLSIAVLFLHCIVQVQHHCALKNDEVEQIF